jgi:iron-sulfur cluster assembly accessory protein
MLHLSNNPETSHPSHLGPMQTSIMTSTRTSCSRALSSAQSVRTIYGSAASRRSFSTAERTPQAQSPALYLDFLAPSWPTINIRTSIIARSRTKTHAAPAHQQSRRLATSTSASTSTSKPAIAITNPRKGEDGSEWAITITPRASHRLTAIAEKDANPDLALRVSVESGGCHGFQYLMSLISSADADAAEDTIFENETGDGYRPKVVMDEPSLELLKGSSIDYTMELIGSQFKVTGIPGAKSSCGCGTSFDIA